LVRQTQERAWDSASACSPIEWGQLQGSGIHQIVERDGTITYTNIAPRRFSAAALQER